MPITIIMPTRNLSGNLLAEYRDKIAEIPETQEKAKEVQKKHKDDDFAKILAELLMNKRAVSKNADRSDCRKSFAEFFA